MRKSVICCLVLATTLGQGCQRAESVPDTSSIDRLLRTAAESGSIPGVAAAAASRDKVLYQRSFGKKDRDSGEPMEADSIFQIASMTKAVTSVAVMQLVEQGRVKLDDPSTVHLPELVGVKLLDGFDQAGKPIYRAPSRPPTVRELLTHTAGYAYSFWNENIKKFEGDRALPFSREHVLSLPLAFEPGTRWGYGPNTDVLGIMVETVSGLTLEEYFQQRIFEPLGMKDSTFQGTASNWPRVVSRYQRQPGGGLGPAVFPKPEIPPITDFYSGGGGLHSTAPDYIRFLRALLNHGELDGKRILRADSVQTMAQNQIGELNVGAMTSLRPELLRDVDFFPKSEDKFGLGFLINSDPVKGGRAAGSLAWAGLFNTYFWLDRENGICGVLMTQVLPFADPAILTLLEDYERAVYSTFRTASE